MSALQYFQALQYTHITDIDEDGVVLTCLLQVTCEVMDPSKLAEDAVKPQKVVVVREVESPCIQTTTINTEATWWPLENAVPLVAIVADRARCS